MIFAKRLTILRNYFNHLCLPTFLIPNLGIKIAKNDHFAIDFLVRIDLLAKHWITLLRSQFTYYYYHIIISLLLSLTIIVVVWVSKSNLKASLRGSR